MLLRIAVLVHADRDKEPLLSALRHPDVLLLPLVGTGGAWSRLRGEDADLVIVDACLVPRPPESSLRALAQLPGAPGVVVLDGDADPEDRARLVGAGASLVLSPDLPVDVLRGALGRLIESRREVVAARVRTDGMDAMVPRLSDFVSDSPAMHAFLRVVSRVVDTDTTVLVLGETGVGKERLARAIHADGRRAGGPFVAVNCAAIPESLLESELFGHEEGAFTGATRARRGWFETAHGGTLFLDEIGELPLHLQAKLLRAVQERAVQPVGSEITVSVDVRFMAASNRDLEADAEAGLFRRDLYYRLSVVSLRLPSLRDRRRDIPGLVHSYLEHFAVSMGRRPLSIAPDALDALVAHDWPGNVRELMNVVERAVLLCDGDVVTEADLAVGLPGGGDAHVPESTDGVVTTPGEAWWERPWAEVRTGALDDLERRYLSRVLAETRGRVGDAARMAGISNRALYEKMKTHDLKKEDFRP